MNNSSRELENFLILNLQSSNNLRNEIEKKDNEKHDLLKDISLNIIDIIDSFERIENNLTEKSFNEDVNKTMNRYKTIQKKLLNLLQRYGITKIEFPENKLIVGFCEVVETEANISKKNDEIISIVRNGYIRGNELLRAAQIIIVKN